MKVTIILILIGAFGAVTKGLLKGLEDLEIGGRVEAIQTTTLLRMARILRRVLETCCHSNFSESQSINTDVKNSQGVNNNNNNNNNDDNHDDKNNNNNKKKQNWKVELKWKTNSSKGKNPETSSRETCFHHRYFL